MESGQLTCRRNPESFELMYVLKFPPHARRPAPHSSSVDALPTTSDDLANGKPLATPSLAVRDLPSNLTVFLPVRRTFYWNSCTNPPVANIGLVSRGRSCAGHVHRSPRHPGCRSQGESTSEATILLPSHHACQVSRPASTSMRLPIWLRLLVSAGCGSGSSVTVRVASPSPAATAARVSP